MLLLVLYLVVYQVEHLYYLATVLPSIVFTLSPFHFLWCASLRCYWLQYSPLVLWACLEGRDV